MWIIIMAAINLESNRGRKKFCDGYQYVFDKWSTDGVKSFWRCEQHMSGCLARLHTDASTVIKRMHDHNYGSNVAGIQVNAVRKATKRRIRSALWLAPKVRRRNRLSAQKVAPKRLRQKGRAQKVAPKRPRWHGGTQISLAEQVQHTVNKIK